MTRERRIAKRIEKRIPVKFIQSGSKEEYAINASLTGFLVESEKFYEVNTKLFLELYIPNQKPVHCETRVVWINPKVLGADIYKIGLNIIKISRDDKERFKKYLYE